MKTREKAFQGVRVAGALIFFSFAFYGLGQARETGQTPPAASSPVPTVANLPPIAQPLVPEGAFAVELANALMAGQPQTAAEAESLLSSMGIEPKNGWIDDYPVTPDIIGEIEKSVAEAAAAKRLKMSKDQAHTAVKNLEAKLGLSIAPATQTAPSGGLGNSTIYKYKDKAGVLHFTDRYESIPQEYRDQIETIRGEARPQPSMGPISNATETQINPEETETEVDHYASNPANPAPEVINNYYYNDGPPVVTYYPPPSPYSYMYAWVPYPFWCSKVFFPGFFILHDFHRTVFFHKRPFVLTNHVVHVRTHTVFRIDPVKRHLGGSAAFHPATSRKLLSTARAQASARAIVTLSQQRGESAKAAPAPRMGKASPSTPGTGASQKVRQNPGAANSQRMTPSIVNPGTQPAPGGTRFSSADGKTRINPSTSERRSETKGSRAFNEVRTVRQPNRVDEGSPKPQTLNGQNGSEPRNPAVPSRHNIVPPLIDSRNSGRPTPSAGAPNLRVEQKEFVRPGSIGNRNEMNFDPPRAFESPTFSPPTGAPQTGVFSRPSVSPGRILSPLSPVNGGSFGGVRGGR